MSCCTWLYGNVVYARHKREAQERSTTHKSMCGAQHERTPTLHHTHHYATHDVKRTNSHICQLGICIRQQSSTATHCNTLQRTATHCNSVLHQTTEQYKNEVQYRTVHATDDIEGHQLYATHNNTQRTTQSTRTRIC